MSEAHHTQAPLLDGIERYSCGSLHRVKKSFSTHQPNEDWRSQYVCVARYDPTAASKPNFAHLFKCSHNYYQTCEKSCGTQNCMPKSPLAKLCEVYILLGFHLMAHNGGVDVLRVIRKKSRGFCEKFRGMYET